MRLTLRTLLAYLDDTLEPAQAKLIGQKVAESDTAQELIARIKQVTRRRRLTVPPATGPGSKLDPNTAAEYLDNTLSPDQLAEVEQICLASDVHLAEIAACHQILTLVLGEPVLIPPSSRQRMYGLAKGPEAVPFRRPPAAGGGEQEVEPDHLPETDETLRLGLPAYRKGGSWSSRLAVLGGGLAAALLLGLAIWQALRMPGLGDEDAASTARQAQAPADTKKDTDAPVATDKDTTKTGKDGGAGQTGKDGDGKQTGKDTGKGDGGTNGKGDPVKPGQMGDKPPDQPGTVVREGGAYLPDAAKPSLLAQKVPKGGWKLLQEGDAKVLTGTPLVALPGFRSVVQLAGGPRLTLWGALREEMFFPPVQESVLQINQHSQFDGDLTLKRGRVLIANTRPKPANVRLRFDNPTNPQTMETWDVRLEEEGTEVLVDLWSYYHRDEPFYEDADNPNRNGPAAALHLLVLKGSVRLRRGFESVRMEAPPKVALVTWNSFEGRPKDPVAMPSVPDFATGKPRLPPGGDPRVLDGFLKARDDVFTNLRGSGKGLEGALIKLRKSPSALDRVLVVRCYGALDDMPELLDALGDNEDRPELRLSAIEVLRGWISTSRDADYVVHKELRNKGYGIAEAVNVMTLLHSFSEKDSQKEGTYGLLIDYLGSPKIAVRELANWHLVRLAPQAAQAVRYAAAAPSELRAKGQAEWGKLLATGKLPPRPVAPPGPG